MKKIDPNHPMLKELDKRRIGERLALIRRIVARTQGDFAAAAEVSRTLYTQYETGSKMPSLEAATRICIAYDLDLNYIFHGELGGLRQRTVDAIKALRAAADDIKQ